LDITELADDLHELRQRVGGVDVDPEQLRDLADHQHHGDAVDVADQHGSGKVVGDPAEAREPGDEEARGDEQREHGRELGGLRAPRRSGREHRGADECRDRALGADDQPPRRSEEGVRDGRQQQGVQTGDGG
jgi:hypothetical protein